MQPVYLSRREALARCGVGMGLLGLSQLLGESGMLSAHAKESGAANPLAPKKPHFPAKAKQVIHIFANGGPSQVDTFDPKPSLAKYAGKSLPTANLRTERRTGAAFPSPFKFKKCGQSGLEVSEIFEHTAKHIDDICVIRSMHADVPNHEPSFLLMNTGEPRLIRPSVGSWVTYGLGTENQNLPGFVAMCPGGYPLQESQNWQCGFLPGVYQGSYVDSRNRDVEKLVEYVKNKTAPDSQRKQLDLLAKLNAMHQAARPNDPQLESRIQSFELAYRMQTEASEAFDLNREPLKIREAYGNSDQARSLLLARRLIERGVRFVQVSHGPVQPWDSHDDLEKEHRRLAGQVDRAIAALISDLKRLGLFESTLILWGGEFGRTPVVELPTPGSNQGKINGRDHNHWGFTCWLAGGGVKGGQAIGATDEFGFKAVEDPVHVHDLHATMLRLLGFDHEKFTYRYAGRDFRLTDVYGRVVKEVLS
ncbi:MAG TPA: DUF1501 domain-containing protein [Gemmata sp.]|nr:DUF1501 domain-containing protein [Gemmata sp.]